MTAKSIIAPMGQSLSSIGEGLVTALSRSFVALLICPHLVSKDGKCRVPNCMHGRRQGDLLRQPVLVRRRVMLGFLFFECCLGLLGLLCSSFSSVSVLRSADMVADTEQQRSRRLSKELYYERSLSVNAFVSGTRLLTNMS